MDALFKHWRWNYDNNNYVIFENGYLFWIVNKMQLTRKYLEHNLVGLIA